MKIQPFPSSSTPQINKLEMNFISTSLFLSLLLQMCAKFINWFSANCRMPPNEWCHYLFALQSRSVAGWNWRAATKSNKIIALSQLVCQLRRHLTKKCGSFCLFLPWLLKWRSIHEHPLGFRHSLSRPKFSGVTHFTRMGVEWKTLLPFFSADKIFLAATKNRTNFVIWVPVILKWLCISTKNFKENYFHDSNWTFSHHSNVGSMWRWKETTRKYWKLTEFFIPSINNR